MMNEIDINRIIEMAWEDRTPFEVIQSEFDLTHGELINLMRNNLKPRSFRLWRKRVTGRKTQGVKLFDVSEEEKVVSVALLLDNDDDNAE